MAQELQTHLEKQTQNPVIFFTHALNSIFSCPSHIKRHLRLLQLVFLKLLREEISHLPKFGDADRPTMDQMKAVYQLMLDITDAFIHMFKPSTAPFLSEDKDERMRTARSFDFLVFLYDGREFLSFLLGQNPDEQKLDPARKRMVKMLCMPKMKTSKFVLYTLQNSVQYMSASLGERLSSVSSISEVIKLSLIHI